MDKITKQEYEKIISRTKKVGRCIYWDGYKNYDGYGTVTLNKRTFKVHRFVYSYFNGDIPQGMYICHKCDHPACCNIKHLFLGTPKDNAQDRIKKNRINFHGNRNPNWKGGIKYINCENCGVKIVKDTRGGGKKQCRQCYLNFQTQKPFGGRLTITCPDCGFVRRKQKQHKNDVCKQCRIIRNGRSKSFICSICKGKRSENVGTKNSLCRNCWLEQSKRPRIGNGFCMDCNIKLTSNGKNTARCRECFIKKINKQVL